MTKQLLGITLVAALAVGCSELDNCPDAHDDIVVDTGTTYPEANLYESSEWTGKLDPFPAKTIVRFKHDLGTRPEIVNTYIAFSKDGTGGDSDVTENTGNQGRIKCVDAAEILVENDTCEENFFLRVTAYATGEGSTKTDCSNE